MERADGGGHIMNQFLDKLYTFFNIKSFAMFPWRNNEKMSNTMEKYI